MKIVVAVAHDPSCRSDVLDARRCARHVAEELERQGHEVQIFAFDPACATDAGKVGSVLRTAQPDCVFNLFEGFADDAFCEADFAACLESLGIPFTGSGSRSLRLCLNKADVKEALRTAGLLVPEGICVRRGDPVPDRLPPFPLFVKPCSEDASVGIDEESLVFDRVSLEQVVGKKTAAFPNGVIVEQFLAGAEYNVGCIGTPPYEILGISVMAYDIAPDLPPFMTYRAKWEPGTREFTAFVPDPCAQLDEKVRQHVSQLAIEAGRLLGCRGYFRVDMREHQGSLYIIDVNPNPDINRDSGFMRQAYARGHAYGEILDKIIKIAIHERY